MRLHTKRGEIIQNVARNERIQLYDRENPSIITIEYGTARQCLYLSDGQRIVLGFGFPGETISPPNSLGATIEAATYELTCRCAYKVLGVDADKILINSIGRALVALSIRARHHLHARMAAFLIDLIDRGLGRKFQLNINHGDIGDHLGMSIYSVSRVLAHFRRTEIIRQSSDRLASYDRAALCAVVDEGFLTPPLLAHAPRIERVH